MNETKKGIKIAVAVAIILAAALLIFTGVQLLGHRADGNAAPDGPDSIAPDKLRPDLDDSTVTLDGVTYVRKGHVETYLVMGIDQNEARRANGSAGGQADVLLLLVTDADTDSFRILPLNRDTVTLVTVVSPGGEITDELFLPICLSHSYGSGGADSCENTVRSVEYLLSGIELDGYIALDLTSIGVLNDAVGGVTVTVESDMTASHPDLQAGATVTLTAETAEAFVRARMELGDEDNLNRMDRQLTFMRAWLSQARRLGSQGVLDLLAEIEDICVTDLTEKRLSSVANDLQKYENRGFLSIDGEYVQTVSYSEFRADPDSVLAATLELYYTEA